MEILLLQKFYFKVVRSGKISLPEQCDPLVGITPDALAYVIGHTWISGRRSCRLSVESETKSREKSSHEARTSKEE